MWQLERLERLLAEMGTSHPVPTQKGGAQTRVPPGLPPTEGQSSDPRTWLFQEGRLCERIPTQASWAPRPR